MSKQIIIVDDHEIIRNSLKRMLDLEDDFEVVLTCENGQMAFDYIKSSDAPIDIVLMDAIMPVLSGIESTKMIKDYNDKIKVLMLTTFSNEKLIFDAFSAKVDGYILKDIKATKLIENIKACIKDEIIIPNDIAQKLAKSISTFNNSSFNKTEQEIIDLLILELTNKEIASRLNISHGTVRNYISDIYKKLGGNDRKQVIEILKDKNSAWF
ncbi:MAG: response regulator transcription factor [Clostridiales bacterium]|nr:response regulator transcription factor [Clostridiales bacterium]